MTTRFLGDIAGNELQDLHKQINNFQSLLITEIHLYKSGINIYMYCIFHTIAHIHIHPTQKVHLRIIYMSHFFWSMNRNIISQKHILFFKERKEIFFEIEKKFFIREMLPIDIALYILVCISLIS